MDIVLYRGSEEKVFWCFDDGTFRDMTHGLGTVYSAAEFDRLYNKLVAEGWKEQDYIIA